MKFVRDLISMFAMSRTERELRSLSDRDLSDIGISRCDIKRIAREADRL